MKWILRLATAALVLVGANGCCCVIGGGSGGPSLRVESGRAERTAPAAPERPPAGKS